MRRSIDLTGVAWEVNVARAAADEVPLDQLPSHKRASAKKMKLVLLALLDLCDESGGEVSYRALQARLGITRSAVNRHINALRDGCLLEVIPQRRGDGTTLPNRYRPSWPNLIDVAQTQGLQWELFQADRVPLQPVAASAAAGQQTTETAGGEEGTAATVAPRGSRPTHLCATGQSSPPGDSETEPPSQNGRDPLPEWEGPPPTVGGTPSHKTGETSAARARALQDSPRRGESSLEEEEQTLLLLSAENLRARLVAYGVDGRGAMAIATERGWTLQQIAELLAWCESRIIDGIKAFGSGLVYRHLQRFPPGAPIKSAPLEAYTRAKRDRELRIAKQRQAERDAAERQKKQVQSSRNEQLRSFRPLLTCLGNSERRELLDRHGVQVDLAYVPELTLLELLEKEATQEASQHVEAGGGEGEPSRSEGG